MQAQGFAWPLTMFVTLNPMYHLPETRREFLMAAAAGLGSAATFGCRPKTEPARSNPGGCIDAHSHVWTPDSQRFPLGPWITPDKMEPPSFTAEELLAVAEPCGVDRVVLIQHAPYYGADNSYLVECAKRHPGRFSIVAIVDERRDDLADHLRRLKAQGVRGIRIGPNRYADRTLVQDPSNWLNAPAMRNLWVQAAEHDLILCPLLNAEQVPTLEPMLNRFPKARLAIDHFGHCSADKPDGLQTLLGLSRFPGLHVKASGFYKFGDRTAPYDDLASTIQGVVEAFGTERVIWGSDCPYQLQSGNTYRDAVRLIESGLDFLKPSDRTAILRDNAERLFFA
jgi:predicted TIM-barrel fold metal-dependent hydrolase